MRIQSLSRTSQRGNQLRMTPMIDIVFLLLVFFILTFKIVSIEGDFHVAMPHQQHTLAPVSDSIPPMTIRLISDQRGELAQIKLNDRDFGVSFDKLNQALIRLIGDDRGPDSLHSQAQVTLDCDYGLRYEHVIQAITAVSGYVDADGNVVPLIEHIQFTQPRAT